MPNFILLQNVSNVELTLKKCGVSNIFFSFKICAIKKKLKHRTFSMHVEVYDQMIKCSIKN
ncbi:hypothetical protein BpHYR1_017511 [Brachionus plicatilis]|uniref:Uncharacterized protein n=1 Tax=Brachionus plicatilis TaxID=10195 RepID=A0A3M7QLF2_BRAPC|nr:hypothetical protein BpHYR1_017511 [Brachionus plicatilis]